jgi:hypothetical protein
MRTADAPVLDKIAALGSRAFERSKELDERLETQFRYINYVFWILFPSGVLLNALGALWGVEIDQESA